MIYSLPPKSEKKNFIFNMLGSTVNAAVSLMLLVVVSHVCGGKTAGIFSLAYSTAQMMYTISAFEMRNIQVTDAKHEIGFTGVFTFRFITTLAMWAFFAFFVSVQGFSGDKLIATIILCVYMTFCAFSDVFQGNLHLNGYLFLSGASLAGQVASAAIGFCVALIISKNLLISLAAMPLAVLVWVFGFDLPFNRNFSKVGFDFNFKRLKNIFLCALPLFLASFMHQYTFNAPKYAIDSLLTEIDQSHYGYLTMPTFFINLLSLFIFRPQLVALAQEWSSGKSENFIKRCVKLYIWVGIISAAALICGFLLGIPVLQLLYGADLSGKRGIFMILLLGGGLSAACTLTLTLLTTMRKQKLCLIAHGAAVLFALIVPEIMVASNGLKGAALAYLCEMAILFVTMIITFIIALRKRGKK